MQQAWRWRRCGLLVGSALLGSALVVGPAHAGSVTVDLPTAAASEGEEPQEGLVVISPVLKTAAAIAGGVPSVLQVVATPALSRAAILPSEIIGPAFDVYVQGVGEATEATATGREALTRFNEAVVPLAPVVNPALRPFGATGIDALAIGMETAGEIAALAGHHDSFPTWMAGVIRSSGRALGF